MAKADRIQHKMVAVLCDGVQLHRVQRFGVTSDLPQEATGELGDSGVVEYIKGVPDVSITLETNEVGSNDTLSLVADKMIRKAETVNFCTSKPRAGFGGWAIRAASSNSTLHSVNAQDLVSCYCDFMVPITEDNLNVTRTMWIHYAALTNVSWSFDVGGYASENYQFKAGNKRWFANALANTRIYKFYPKQASSGGAANSITYRTGSSFSSIIKSARPLFYCENDKIYYNRASAAVLGIDGIGTDGMIFMATAGYGPNGGLTGTRNGRMYFSTTNAGVISTANQVITNLSDNLYCVYRAIGSSAYGTGIWADATRAANYSLDTSPGYLITSTAGAHGGTGRAFIKAWLVNRAVSSLTQTAVGVMLRLQTVNIDIALTSDQLLQLGQQRPYGVSRQVPVPVNVSISAKDSDLQLFANALATSAANVKTYSIENFNGQNELQITVYKESSKATKLRTFIINKMAVTGENNDMAYGGDGTYEINFTADNIRILGHSANITGY